MLAVLCLCYEKELEMRNCKELRGELSVTFKQLKAGKIQPREAAALANLAGKMIGSAKAQIDYQTLHKQPSRIEFLEE